MKFLVKIVIIVILTHFIEGNGTVIKEAFLMYQLLTLRNAFREEHQNENLIGVDCIAGVCNYSYIFNREIKK